MTHLLSLFSANLLPILLCSATGFVLAKTMSLDPKTLSRVIFYIFSPCLVFQLLAASQLEHSAVLQIALFAVTVTVAIGLITFAAASILRFERKTLVALLLVTMFTNAGNYGLSLNGFTFGEQTLAYASIYFVCSATMMYTLGVAIASMGKASFKDSIIQLLKLPTLYGLLIGVLFNATGWHLPIAIDRAVSTLGDGAIPAMLVVLGLQLGNAKLEGRWSTIGLATGLRLVAGPLVAYGISALFHMQGHALQAGVSEASMPTAVMTIILATEFDVRPAFVSTVVAATTILSPLTLTPLISLLGGT